MALVILAASLLVCASAAPYGYYSAPRSNFGYSFGYVAPVYAHGYQHGAHGYPYGAYPYGAHHGHAAYAHPYAHGVYASQYHSQDTFGSAAYGHAEPHQAHNAVRDYSGAVKGKYSYVSPEGKPIYVDYIADAAGFRVVSNALPVAPTADLMAPLPVDDTPEVKAARAEHLKAVEEAKAADH